MEENQNPTETTQEVVQETPKVETVQSDSNGVNFSSIPVRSSKPKKTKAFLGIFILIIFVVGGFLIFKDNKGPEEEINNTESNQEVTETPAATESPNPTDKASIIVDIQNGTGIAGEAAYLRDSLKSIGYSQFKLGNATTSDNVTTTVTFKSGINQAVADEVTVKLNDLYKEVTSSTSATQKSDVVVVTGLRKGATAKPSASPTASVSPSASPTATTTPSATP